MKQKKVIEFEPLKTHSSSIMTNLFYGLMICLFLWGVALRAPEILSGNFLFGHDHGRDYLAAYSIAVNHKMTLIGAEAGSGVAGINGVFHGPGYFYLMALSYILFSGNPMGGEFFMFLFGLFAMIAAGYVGYTMMGKAGALLSLFFVAVSPLIVSQSRFIWSSHPITVFVILALYFVYKIADNPKIYAPLAVFTAAFTYHSQLGVAVPLTVPIFLSLITIYRIKDIRVYVYCVVAFAVALLPMALFDARHGLMATKSLITYLMTGGTGVSHTPILDPIRLASHKFDYWNNFYNTFTFEFGMVPWSVQMNTLFLSIPAVIAGIVMIKDGKLRKFTIHIIIMTVFTCGAYLLLNNTVWDYYLTHTRIGYIMLWTIGGVGLYSFLRNSWTGEKTPVLQKTVVGIAASLYCLFLIVLLSGSIFRQYVNYTIDIHDSNSFEKIQGKYAAIDLIYNDADKKPFSVYEFVPSIYTWAYQYLFATYGLKKYGYAPTDVGDKPKAGLHGTVYLIMEKGNALWLNGWLDTVVVGGKSEWKKTILNGLIIEKRIYP
jgi:hypothetical protein